MRILFAFAVALAMVLPQGTKAGVLLDVFASSAPNVFGSPSWSTYLSNAMTGLAQGLSNVGGARDTDPTAYEQLGNSFEAGDAIVTSFSSWRGAANAASPFDNERGNRLHFGLLAQGTGGTQFSLSDVGYEVASSDPWNALGYSGTLAGTTLNGTTRIGVLYGANGVFDGGLGDDVLLNSGEGDAVLVDALIYVGVGNAFWPQPAEGETQHEAIDGVAAFYDQYVDWISGTYTISTVEGEFLGSAQIDNANFVSEPMTGMVLGLAVARLFWARRRRSSRT
jgi:hypothetical protein